MALKLTPQELLNDKKRLKRMAKVLAQACFRNVIERLHTGTSPSSLRGDFTDVVVKSPYGEIPWNQLSRISDDEIQWLNREVASRTFSMLQMWFKHWDELTDALGQRDFVPDWDDPEFPVLVPQNQSLPRTSISTEPVQPYFSISDLAKRWRCSRGKVYNVLHDYNVKILDLGTEGKRSRKLVDADAVNSLERALTKRINREKNGG